MTDELETPLPPLPCPDAGFPLMYRQSTVQQYGKDCALLATQQLGEEVASLKAAIRAADACVGESEGVAGLSRCMEWFPALAGQHKATIDAALKEE